MWGLGQKAEKASRLPSECVPGLLAEIGEWGVYCFDNAIGFFMRVIENALHERVETGTSSELRSAAKYTLMQLLEDDFHLPRPLTHKQSTGKIGAQVKALFGMTAPRKRGRKRGNPVEDAGKAVNPLVAQWLARKGGQAAQ